MQIELIDETTQTCSPHKSRESRDKSGGSGTTRSLQNPGESRKLSRDSIVQRAQRIIRRLRNPGSLENCPKSPASCTFSILLDREVCYFFAYITLLACYYAYCSMHCCTSFMFIFACVLLLWAKNRCVMRARLKTTPTSLISMSVVWVALDGYLSSKASI